MSSQRLESRDVEIARLYGEGYSLAAIGRLHDLSRERVRQILAEAGVDTRPAGRPRKVRKSQQK